MGVIPPSGRKTVRNSREAKAELDAVWTIVKRENMELRTSHPIVYRWARAYLDSREI